MLKFAFEGQLLPVVGGFCSIMAERVDPRRDIVDWRRVGIWVRGWDGQCTTDGNTATEIVCTDACVPPCYDSKRLVEVWHAESGAGRWQYYGSLLRWRSYRRWRGSRRCNHGGAARWWWSWSGAHAGSDALSIVPNWHAGRALALGFTADIGVDVATDWCVGSHGV